MSVLLLWLVYIGVVGAALPLSPPCPAETEPCQDNLGTTSCCLCSAPTVWSPSQGGCHACPAGEYASGLSSCVPCPVGTYNPAPGAVHCLVCSPGSVALSTGQTGCTQCGSMSRPLGTVACARCPDGHVGTSQGVCEPCLPGSFLDPLQGVCVQCKEGTASSQAGSHLQCPLCIPGTYQALQGQQRCLECPKGTIAATNGSATCESCPLGSTTFETGSDVCVDTTVFTQHGDDCTAMPSPLFIPSILAFIAIVFLVGGVGLAFSLWTSSRTMAR